MFYSIILNICSFDTSHKLTLMGGEKPTNGALFALTPQGSDILSCYIFFSIFFFFPILAAVRLLWRQLIDSLPREMDFLMFKENT